MNFSPIFISFLQFIQWQLFISVFIGMSLTYLNFPFSANSSILMMILPIGRFSSISSIIFIHIGASIGSADQFPTSVMTLFLFIMFLQYFRFLNHIVHRHTRHIQSTVIGMKLQKFDMIIDFCFLKNMFHK